MRITWRLVLGFLAVSVLALLAALARPSWPQGRGAAAPTAALTTGKGTEGRTLRAATSREAARRAKPGDTVCIGLALHSTGARVDGNTLHPGIRYEVGIDASSRPDYRGPEPGGLP
ncbi:hypothetical protein AB0D24_08785 [Streptomyces javensis]|uniref:hypothetical protein n=1 Tax=Streptomyces javensis TaxID=114698 RepID=UPI0033EBC966